MVSLRVFLVTCGIALMPSAPLLWAAQDQESAPAIIRVTTRLVLVDVIVTDGKGRPVTDLTRDDFEVLEDGQRQHIAHFTLERRTLPAQEPSEVLPPYIFTNSPAYKAARQGSLSILLLDALNTPTHDQLYARREMLRYLSEGLPLGERMAVFLLGNSLRLLQDFTDDPRLLQAALSHYGGHSSIWLNESDPTQVALPPPPELPELAKELESFEREGLDFQFRNRVYRTLEAMEAIARWLGAYPVRKNLIWVSASFPLLLDLGDIGYLRTFKDEMERAARTLTNANVSVYPVDVRGLLALNAGAEYGGWGALTGGRGAYLDSLQTMSKLADLTGGCAYYNTNDIAWAVQAALEDSAAYYLLGYYPTNKEWDERFRTIQVKVRRRGLKIRHRKGYLALAPMERREASKEEELLAAARSPLEATGITLWMSMLRSAGSGESTTVAFRFMVDTESLLLQAEGERYGGSVDLLVLVQTPEGKVVKMLNQTLALNLRELGERSILHECNLELLPGTYQVKVVLRDNLSGQIGTLQAPLTLSTSSPS